MNDRLVLEKELFYCEMAVKSLQKEVRKLRKSLSGDKTLFQEMSSSRRRRRPSKKKSSAAPTRKTHFSARRQLEGHFGKVYALNWSAQDEGALASSSQDGNLILWDAHRQVKRVGIPLKSSWVMACQLSPRDAYVACGGLDNKVTVYDVVDSEGWTERKPYKELAYHGSYVSCLRFVDEARLLSSSGDMTCLRWDLVKGIPDRHFLDHTGDVMALAVASPRTGARASRGPLGAAVGFVSVSCDNTAKAWDFRMQECCGNFEGHRQDVNTVDFFPDGNSFFTGSDDGTVKLFDLRAYRCLNSYKLSGPLDGADAPGVTAVRSSVSGKYAFAAYDQSPHMCCWNTAETAVSQEFSSLFTRVSALDLNCSGKAIATGSWDFRVTVWS